MNCQPKILLDILTEDEAWALFKTTANLEDDSTVSNVAKRITKECGPVPVAIVSVAKALRGKSLHGWERALIKLQEGEYPEIQDMSREGNAYKSLKFSFDELPREETKRCLLLCSLYPEDHEICVEDLSRYTFGLQLYKHARSLKDNLSEVVDALDELKDRHLLLEAGSRGHVKMHDLVRDVVLLLGKSYTVARESKTEKEFVVGGSVGFEEWTTDESFRDCAAISLLENEIGRFPDQLDCPRLEMLLFSSSRQEFINISDKSFEGMQKLQVLSLTHVTLSIQSLECLTCLRTLELTDCKLTDLASLQVLKTLEILSFLNSDIRELPAEIGELKNLKLLELTNCYLLGIIPSNLIQNLFKLEELHIGVYEEWGEDTEKASLMELKSLQQLNTLSVTPRIDIPEDFVFSNNLTCYHIHICDCECPSFPSRIRFPASRTLCFIPTEETVRMCKELFRNVYNIQMDYNPGRFKNMMPDMSEEGFQVLSNLDIYGFDLECLVSSRKREKIASNAFSNLVELNINFVGSLREICDGLPPEGFLKKLQKLKITECNNMITIFPAKLLQGMLKLESVFIAECESLRDVFQLDGVDDANEYLSYLTTLELKYMDALTCIFKGPGHHVNLRSLTHITLWDCGILKYVISPSLAQTLVHLERLDIESCGQLEHIISEKDEDGEETFSENHPQQACLQNLKEVRIKDCKKLEYVFPMSIARGLFHLEVLKISDAAQLMQVFGNEDRILFSYPTELELHGSSRVGYLFSRDSAALMPSLCCVEIHKCPQLLKHLVVQISPKMSTNSEQLRVADTERIPLEILDLEGGSLLESIIAKEDYCNDKKEEISLNDPFLPVCFTSLKKIRIVDCNKLKILLPISVARGLPHLTELHIQASRKLVEIFGSEEQAEFNNMEEFVLPELLKLHLEELPVLINFCPKGYHFIFPSLETLRVITCPEMTTSFTTATDASVHAKPEAPTLSRDTSTGSATSQVIVAPRSNGSDWIRFEGKWISKEEAGKKRRR